jgi:hypothetical protein
MLQIIVYVFRVCAQFAISLVGVESLKKEEVDSDVQVIHATSAETCIGKELMGFQLRPADCITPNFKTEFCNTLS